MFETDTEKAQQIQSDVLLEKTSDNPNFAYHKVPAKNKSLDTSDKRIVGAINELLKKQNSLQNAVQTSINQSFVATGDIISDPELLERLRAVSPNLIEAVCDHEEKINTLQELLEELKNRKSSDINNTNSNQTINIGGMSWDFGEDDMGNLNALLNVTGKNIKDSDIMLGSKVMNYNGDTYLREVKVNSGETIDVYPSADIKRMAPVIARYPSFYNSESEIDLTLYPIFDEVDTDSNNIGERTIKLNPPMGYYSTKGMPYIKINVIPEDDVPQIRGAIFSKPGESITVKKGSVSTGYSVPSQFIRVDENFNIINLIAENFKITRNFKKITSPIGEVIEIPKVWVKTEILQDGPYAGMKCWWVSDKEVDGFHIHPAFLKPDGTSGNLQITAYVMQRTASSDTAPGTLKSILGAYDSSKASNGYYKDTTSYENLITRADMLNAADPDGNWHMFNIYEQHLLGRIVLIEFGESPNLNQISPYTYHEDSATSFQTYSRRPWFHGICDPDGSTTEMSSIGNRFASGIFLDGISTDEDGILYLMKQDGSREVVSTGLDYSYQYSRNIYKQKFETVNDIDLTDIMLTDINVTTGTDPDYKAFSSVSQCFGKNKFMATSGKDNMFAISAAVKTGTNKYAWRAARVV